MNHPVESFPQPRHLDARIKRRVLVAIAALHLRARQARARWQGVDLAQFERDLPLICVITGMPKSGTTLLSQLLNGHPRIAGGFECGILLSNVVDYHLTQPYYDWLLRRGRSWAVLEQDREKLRKARSYAELYCILNAIKGRAHGNQTLREVMTSSDLIFDKTPNYSYRLTCIMGKINRPFVMTVKDPLEVIASAQKHNHNLRNALRRYEKVLRETLRAQAAHGERLLVVRYRSLAQDPVRVMGRVKQFIGLEDDIELSLERYNARMQLPLSPTWSFHNDQIAYVPPQPDLSAKEQKLLDAFLARNGARLQAVLDLAI